MANIVSIYSISAEDDSGIYRMDQQTYSWALGHS